MLTPPSGARRSQRSISSDWGVGERPSPEAASSLKGYRPGHSPTSGWSHSCPLMIGQSPDDRRMIGQSPPSARGGSSNGSPGWHRAGSPPASHRARSPPGSYRQGVILGNSPTKSSSAATYHLAATGARLYGKKVDVIKARSLDPAAVQAYAAQFEPEVPPLPPPPPPAPPATGAFGAAKEGPYGGNKPLNRKGGKQTSKRPTAVTL